jgi:hypothetical protein
LTQFIPILTQATALALLRSHSMVAVGRVRDLDPLRQTFAHIWKDSTSFLEILIKEGDRPLH